MNYTDELSEFDHDVEMDSDSTINSFKMRLNRVKFEKLEPVATMKLQHFVKTYGVSVVQKNIAIPIFDKGILTITLPKVEKIKKKQVKIKVK